jgi:hypothetical protein
VAVVGFCDADREALTKEGQAKRMATEDEEDEGGGGGFL